MGVTQGTETLYKTYQNQIVQYVTMSYCNKRAEHIELTTANMAKTQQCHDSIYLSNSL